MARVFGYLMQKDVDVTDKAIFEDVSKIIGDALKATHSSNSELTGIANTALGNSLEQLL